MSANTVKHRHANIHKALSYAYKTDLIQTNPADKVELPTIDKFVGHLYNAASLLFSQGVSLKEIQAWLGHSTIGTTANIYTHLDENNKLSSANAILSILPEK